MPSPGLAPLLALALLGAVGAAHAHKVITGVFASGDVIEGEIGFSSGEMAAHQPVEVYDPDGRKLGETTTDADGFFSFPPAGNVTHVFRANLGAGHVATFELAAADLPAAVRAGTAGADGAPGTQPAPGAAPGAGSGAALDLAQHRELIAEVVREEMKPLRRELAAYREHHDLQTVLGGLGYIAGLFGVGYYVAARREARRS